MADTVSVLASICRASSILSIFCTLFIFTSFAALSYFRKPINRLIVYASIGNTIANAATTVSILGIPEYGGNIGLCRFQAFVGQMFVPADALWVLAMAINVHLTIFRHYDSKMLRKLEPWYFGVIYGISALPALVYVILDMKPFNKGTIGPAGLWCWVSDKYEWARFAFLYIPLWVVVISALGIYVRVGILLIKMTLEVRSASNSSVWSVMSFSHFPPKGADNLPRRDESEQHLQPEDYVEEPERAARADGRRSSDIEMEPIQPIQTVESRSRSVGTIHITHAVSKQTADSGAYVPPVDPPALVVDRSKQRVDAVDREQVDREQVEQAQPQRQESRPWRRPENQAAWSYTKVAFLMFLALIIVWVPPTVNRIYDLSHADPSFALEAVVAAAVPMQGFWNFTFYVTTSLPQCKRAWRDIRQKCRSRS